LWRYDHLLDPDLIAADGAHMAAFRSGAPDRPQSDDDSENARPLDEAPTTDGPTIDGPTSDDPTNGVLADDGLQNDGPTNFAPPGNDFAPPPERNSSNFAPPPDANRWATNDLQQQGGAKLPE
jgi:hypothetical protein